MERVRDLCRGCSRPCTARPASASPRRRSGSGLRFAVVDLMPDDKPAPIALINPEVMARSEEQATREEGCLSLPGQYADVTRPARVTVRYTDADGREAADRGGGAAGRLPAARDRPPGWHPVRRSPLGAEAQHDPAPAGQGAAAEARRGDVARCASRSWAARTSPFRRLRALHAAGHEIAAVYCQPAQAGRARLCAAALPGAGRGGAARPAGAHAGAAARRCRRSRRRSPRWSWMRRWWRPTG